MVTQQGSGADSLLSMPDIEEKPPVKTGTCLLGLHQYRTRFPGRLAADDRVLTASRPMAGNRISLVAY
jgi:hypothetical protein